MSAHITGWTDTRAAQTGAAVAQAISFEWREDGRVRVLARDPTGREVELALPAFVWARMAKEISWNAPRHEAELRAVRLGMAPDLRPA